MIHYNRRGRGRKKVYKKQAKNQRIQISKMVCPYCHIIIAPYDKQVVTSKGLAHHDCVVAKAIERLDAIESPRPPVFSLGRDFQNHLARQAEILLSQSSDDYEEKLAEIIDISEEIFFQPIDLSTLIAKQSQGLSP
ncbi:MAG: hypothetical protein U9R14_03880 [Patescibacteria group bacterium]|nr:hypothetical protein [Patescibacteria group bacterium]